MSLLVAPFGAHGVNLAAISAAICTGPHAHEDPSKRYVAAVWCGLLYAVAGVFGATLAALFAALLSAAFLGEAPRAYHALAFALIVGGIVVSSRR